MCRESSPPAVRRWCTKAVMQRPALFGRLTSISINVLGGGGLEQANEDLVNIFAMIHYSKRGRAATKEPGIRKQCTS